LRREIRAAATPSVDGSAGTYRHSWLIPFLRDDARVGCGEFCPALPCAVFPYSGVGVRAAVNRGHATGWAVRAGSIETSKSHPAALDLLLGQYLSRGLYVAHHFAASSSAILASTTALAVPVPDLDVTCGVRHLGRLQIGIYSLSALCAAPTTANTAAKITAAESHPSLFQKHVRELA